MSANRSLHSAITTLQTVVVIIIVTVAAGGFWWYSSSLQREQHSTPQSSVELPPTYRTYSRFGFSFDYPEGMVFSAGSLKGGFDHAHPLTGDIQGVHEGISEAVGVIWFAADSSPELELILDLVFASAQESGIRIDDRGAIKNGMKDVCPLKYQAFEVANQGIQQNGAVAAWYCEDAQRVYTLYVVTLPEIVTQEELESKLQSYLDSFVHEGVETPVTVIESYWPTEGWRIATHEAVGIDSAKLDEMIDVINKQDIDADSVMIIRDGYLVMDAYFPPFDEGEIHIVYSCTKSVVSTLIGLAYEEGLIESLDQHLLDFFLGRTVENVNTWKEEITLRDLLSMSAGFDARDSWLYDWEWLGRMHDASDAVQYMLDLEVIEEPGIRFEYTNGVSHLLSCIVTETTGMSALEYAREKLFEPLGITGVEWDTDSLGRNWGYSNLYLTPHDMAKIGYLFLNEGEWDGQEIVSREWVEEATSKHLDANIMPGYGYQWWVSPNGYYSAVGYKGQFIHVVPDLDLVMVTTGSNANDFDRILALLETYVIPAVID